MSQICREDEEKREKVTQEQWWSDDRGLPPLYFTTTALSVSPKMSNYTFNNFPLPSCTLLDCHLAGITVILSTEVWLHQSDYSCLQSRSVFRSKWINTLFQKTPLSNQFFLSKEKYKITDVICHSRKPLLSLSTAALSQITGSHCFRRSIKNSPQQRYTVAKVIYHVQ